MTDLILLATLSATIDRKSGEIIIDKSALARAILWHGATSENNAAAWLVQSVRSQQPDIDIPSAPANDLGSADLSEFQLVLSESLRTSVLPRARLIAELTSNRSICDVRHVVMSMLHDRGDEWTHLGFPDSEGAFILLRDAIVTSLDKQHDGEEQMDVWHTLTTAHPSAVLAARNTRQPPAGARKRGIKKADRATPTPPPESLPIHTDDPAIVDLLGREGFAEVLAQRIVQAHERAALEGKASKDDDDNRAFIVHMHGPWGSGKSTVLNFVRKRLEARAPAPWLVVEFNAWRSQRLKPPWWSLILQVEQAASRCRPDFLGRAALRFRWFWMRTRADILPAAIGLASIICAGLLLGWAVLGKANEPLKGIAGMVTGIGGIYAFSRSLLFGSGSAAKAYEDLRSDPYGPMMKLFARLVRAIDRPIIVFIDDLDRCESGYVCDLLESIQTMLRAAPITYLIAADRKWICTSFEKRYADFAGQASDAGRPLGYQFLDKLFQISANLPVIPASLRAGFWNGLLHAAPAATNATERADVEREAKAKVDSAPTPEARHALIEDEADPVKKQAIRTQVAVKQSSPVEVAQTEHRLKALGALIEPNPRSMKRLANAVGMNQARLTLEGRDSSNIEAIARWTIIDLRWPLLADWLREEPARIAARPIPATADAGDKAMATLLRQAEVVRVVGAARATGRLTPAVLSGLVA